MFSGLAAAIKPAEPENEGPSSAAFFLRTQVRIIGDTLNTFGNGFVRFRSQLLILYFWNERRDVGESGFGKRATQIDYAGIAIAGDGHAVQDDDDAPAVAARASIHVRGDGSPGHAVAKCSAAIDFIRRELDLAHG